MELDTHYVKFEKEINTFPNYFQLTNIANNLWKKVERRLQDEKEELNDLDSLDRYRKLNLDGCIKYNLGHFDEAEKLIFVVIEESESTNINACAMMAIISYRKSNLSEAREYLQTLKNLGKQNFHVDVARAEIAYAYTRLDARFYEKAINIYEEVITRNPNISLWKFGLAMTYRRCLHFSLQTLLPDVKREVAYKHARELLLLNINCKKTENLFKAECLIELAGLYTHVICPENQNIPQIEIISLIEKAVETAPEHPPILMKAGKLMKHNKKFEAAQRYLQKAYEIQPNSFICHHLGLIIKSQITFEAKKKRGYWRPPSIPYSVNIPGFSDNNVQYERVPNTNQAQTSTTPAFSQTSCSRLSTDRETSSYDYEAAQTPVVLSSRSKVEDVHHGLFKKPPLSRKSEKDQSLKMPRQTYNIAPKKSLMHKSSNYSKLDSSGTLVPTSSKKLSSIINSPKITHWDEVTSSKLERCNALFKQATVLSEERNMAAYYDWGLTLLHMTPIRYEEALEKFSHVIQNDRSPYQRYRCFEQAGICHSLMAELLYLDSTQRDNHLKNSNEMFQRAISCWAHCQKLDLHKDFDDPEHNCQSFKTIREIILNQGGPLKNKDMKDLAQLYYLVQKYGDSLRLYQEVYDKLQECSGDNVDLEVIKGIIQNHLKMKQSTGVLDFLALILCSKEGYSCRGFITDVLNEMVKFAIDEKDFQLIESVLEFEKGPQTEYENDVIVLFDERNQSAKKYGQQVFKWLKAFCKVTANSERVKPGMPTFRCQTEILSDCKMAIIVFTEDALSSELSSMIDVAVSAKAGKYRLKHILPVTANDATVPDSLISSKGYNLRNISEETENSFLHTFCELYLK